MNAPPLSTEPYALLEFLTALDDPRDPDRTLYPLTEILFLVIAASLSGCDDLPDMELFGQHKLDWLRRFLSYRRGTPSHDTLGRVLGAVDKRAFEDCFIHWVGRHFSREVDELVNMDGKRQKGSADKASQSKRRDEGGKYADLVVNVFASGAGIVLAQRNVNETMDEVQGAMDLLDFLDLPGSCVSGDSNFCTRQLIAKIIERKGDYLLALKGKSPILHQAVQAAFAAEELQPLSYVTQEQDHGRQEVRTYRVLEAQHLDTSATASYVALRQVLEVTRQRTVLISGQQSTEIHYYITSLDQPLEQLAAKVRAHWAIENRLHWVLDVEFKEDANRQRTKNEAANSSLIRKIALNLLRLNPDKKSLKGKRMACAISDDYREKILLKI